MDSDIKFVIVSIVASIALALTASLWFSYWDDKAFIAAGYTQETLPGVNGVHWVKK